MNNCVDGTKRSSVYSQCVHAPHHHHHPRIHPRIHGYVVVTHYSSLRPPSLPLPQTLCHLPNESPHPEKHVCTRPLTHTPPSPTYRLSSGASKPYHLKRPAQPPQNTNQPLTTLHSQQTCFFKIAIFLRCSKLNIAIVKRTSGEKKRKTRRASASAPANAQHSLRTRNVPTKKPRCQKMGPGPHHPPK